ncbi:MAG TPA: AMP-binding protein, partial [Gammaproteobacteria bacterium]|nr:AMP-binding protein [Gammaproteobacteria bacterium]
QITHDERVTVDPTQAETLLDVLTLYAEKSPKKPHIYFQLENGGQEIITYETLFISAMRVACGLRERGLQEGETVAIMQPTSPAFMYAFFGTLLAGGIPAPIYPPFRAHMLEVYAKTEARILNNAEARILVTFTEAEKLSYLLQAFVPSIKAVVTVAALLNPQELMPTFQAKADNAALLQYTSGSTSDPKGVLLTHANLLANIRAYGKAAQITPEDVAVSWLPLYHDLGLIGMWLGCFYYGIPLVLMTPFSFLNRPERWLWTIHHHRGTISGAPNFAYELCIRKIPPALLEGLDLSCWRMAVNGAEKVYPRTLQQFAEKFAAFGFQYNALVPVYGLAESTVGLTIPRLGQPFRVDYINREKFEENRQAQAITDNKTGIAVDRTVDKDTLAFVSCGIPIEGHEIRVVDEGGQVLADRTVGYLQFRGPSTMQGYYHNPRATAAVFHADGWVDTGDLAYIAENELFVTGRSKDLIIKAGRNLYPAEIEGVASHVAGLRQGCIVAFGVTNAERGTEQLIIVAETKEKNKMKRTAIIHAVLEAIAAALDIVPDQVVLTAPRMIPKTSSGKLQRAACKTLYLQGKLSRSLTPPWLQTVKLGVRWGWKKCIDGVVTIGKIFYTVYAALIMAITLLFLYAIVRFTPMKTAAAVCRYWAKGLCIMIGCPIKKIGAFPPQPNTPFVYVANHASYLDAIVLLSILPAGTRFVGKKELFSQPILGTMIRRLDYLPLDRIDLPKGIEDTQHIEAALAAGDSILIFPEGTFGYTAGLRPFRLGAFKIAAEQGIAVCPIALQGTRSIWRDDEKLLRPGKIIVTICSPILSMGSEWSDITLLRNQVRAEIAQYCGEPSLDFIIGQTVAPKVR